MSIGNIGNAAYERCGFKIQRNLITTINNQMYYGITIMDINNNKCIHELQLRKGNIILKINDLDIDNETKVNKVYDELSKRDIKSIITVTKEEFKR